MPIYEYVCHACGLEKEHLQKMSDAPIAQCPACGSTEYIKKVSAASFRLKGSGWYVTDFKNKKNTQSEVGSQPTEKTSKETTDPSSNHNKSETETTNFATSVSTSTPSASTTD